MSQLHGVGVGRGIAAGKALRMPDRLTPPTDAPLEGDAEGEVQRATDALHQVAGDLMSRGETVGGEAQDVLQAAALMAQDPALADDVAARIRAGVNAEFAVQEAFGQFKQMLVALGGYMAERATDLDDVAQRVIAQLRGVPAPGVPMSDEPFVLIARDLAPADTATLDLDKVLGLVTQDGGPTSHTAILARSKSITAIVGVPELLDKVSDRQLIIADARSGEVTLDPTAEQQEAAEAERIKRAEVANAPITPGALADGTPVQLLANVGRPEEAAAALELGAEGVGLFRTEFLFLDSKTPPTVEQQTEQYAAMLRAFEGKKVVVRVLDAGADKPLAFLNDDDEENPALGLRGIRALRANEKVLRDQLQALADADAATDADLWVMAPMIANAEETEYFVTISREYGLKTVGAMAEVPSIALQGSQVLERCDFVSIGTNDLTQYTFAADRLLGTVAQFQDPWQPAVLRLVGMLGDAGAAADKPVGVCGEAATDPALAAVLVGLGVTSLSMSAAALGDVRAELKSVTLEEARERAARALTAVDAAEARRFAAGA
ncbi:MAG: phosphoenolpyruvate--protein phosphotransferase [Agrococcus casei]|uniref:phosphoenolpyruvate--protein phosphotransferase n=1 Tax=Agrococcus casei TaxID=343512 RepID=UPI003F8DA3BC